MTRKDDLKTVSKTLLVHLKTIWVQFSRINQSQFTSTSKALLKSKKEEEKNPETLDNFWDWKRQPLSVFNHISVSFKTSLFSSSSYASSCLIAFSLILFEKVYLSVVDQSSCRYLSWCPSDRYDEDSSYRRSVSSYRRLDSDAGYSSRLANVLVF